MFKAFKLYFIVTGIIIGRGDTIFRDGQNLSHVAGPARKNLFLHTCMLSRSGVQAFLKSGLVDNYEILVGNL